MNESIVVNKLLDAGRRLFDAPAESVRFTNEADADALLNDLNGHPHAFVIACVMDRQIKAERAWIIPHRFREKLGDFDFSTLAALSLDQIKQHMNDPEPLHRFPEKMSVNFYETIQRIARKYDGNASAIWLGNPSSADVIYRFLEFRGVGPKIATMATNILARDFKIPFADYFAIDISADVQVKRVFSRLGLTEPDDSTEAVIYRAKALHPQFPGLLDLPAWEIGRNYCRPSHPKCDECFMCDVCVTAQSDK